MLLPHGRRQRVSHVELGETPLNVEEILAYPLIFGSPPAELYPSLLSEVEDAVMRGAYRLYQRLEGKTSRKAARLRELTEQIRDRLAASAQSPRI